MSRWVCVCGLSWVGLQLLGLVRLGWQGGHGGGGGEDQGGPAGEDGLSSGDSTPKRVRLVYVRVSFSAVNIYLYL